MGIISRIQNQSTPFTKSFVKIGNINKVKGDITWPQLEYYYLVFNQSYGLVWLILDNEIPSNSYVIKIVGCNLQYIKRTHQIKILTGNIELGNTTDMIIPNPSLRLYINNMNDIIRCNQDFTVTVDNETFRTVRNACAGDGTFKIRPRTREKVAMTYASYKYETTCGRTIIRHYLIEVSLLDNRDMKLYKWRYIRDKYLRIKADGDEFHIRNWVFKKALKGRRNNIKWVR